MDKNLYGLNAYDFLNNTYFYFDGNFVKNIIK